VDENEKTPVTARSVSMRVKILTYGHGIYRGELISRYLEKPFVFHTLVRMIEKMESIFNDKKFPQAFLSPRTFKTIENGKPAKISEKQPEEEDLALIDYEGVATGSCTFEIRVKSRQNATWQGQIYWVEKQAERDFQCVLDMLRLIGDALVEVDEHTEQAEW